MVSGRRARSMVKSAWCEPLRQDLSRPQCRMSAPQKVQYLIYTHPCQIQPTARPAALPEWQEWRSVLNFLASASVRPGKATFAATLAPVGERFRVKSGSERGRGGSCESGPATPSSMMASIRLMSSLVRLGGRAWAGGGHRGIGTPGLRARAASPWADGEHRRWAQLLVMKLHHPAAFTCQDLVWTLVSWVLHISRY